MSLTRASEVRSGALSDGQLDLNELGPQDITEIDTGVVLFNTEATYPISANLAKRLAKIPNICAYKQGVSKISSTIALRSARRSSS